LSYPAEPSEQTDAALGPPSTQKDSKTSSTAAAAAKTAGAGKTDKVSRAVAVWQVIQGVC